MELMYGRGCHVQIGELIRHRYMATETASMSDRRLARNVNHAFGELTVILIDGEHGIMSRR